MQKYDAVFIGSGHNALVAAALLARAGQSVLVLERNDRPGGMVRTEALTLPGFLHDTFSAAHPLFLTGQAYAALGPELEERGLHYLNTDLPTGVSMEDGRTAVLPRDFDAAVAECDRLAPGDGDGAAFAALMEEFGAHAGDVFGLFAQDLASGPARETIRKLMVEPSGAFTELASGFFLTARDVLEGRFRSDVLRAMVAPWVMHLGRTPDGANGGFWVPLTLMALMGGGMAIPRGGSEMLAKALARLITDHGGEVRAHTAVERVLVRGGRVAGVRTAGGDEVEARTVVASVNPDQLYLQLLEGADVPAPLARQASRWRYGRGCVQLNLALSEPPRWADERMASVGQPHLTAGLESCAVHVTEALNGWLPANPTITVDCPTTLDPSRAPAGKAVLRVQMLEVPTRPRGDAAGRIDVGDGTWSEDLKRRYADRLLEVVGRHIPNVPGAVLGMHVVSPAEIAAFNPNAGPGDPYGGSHDVAQSYLFRPLPGQPSHRTPVPGLLMLGAATWPGHGVNGGSGWIVAQELLGAGRAQADAASAA